MFHLTIYKTERDTPERRSERYAFELRFKANDLYPQWVFESERESSWRAAAQKSWEESIRAAIALEKPKKKDAHVSTDDEARYILKEDRMPRPSGSFSPNVCNKSKAVAPSQKPVRLCLET